MEGVRLSKAELKESFGLTERQAVRVLALRRKGLGVTAALLEEAVRTKAVGDLLLSPRLLKEASGLDAGRFSKDYPDAEGLTVVKGVLGLEEELLADEAESESAAIQPASQATSFQFSADELKELRMTVLTSVDADAKVEALRKLSHAQLPPEERGAVFLRALLDADSKVRTEALSALKGVGLDPAVAESLRGLHTGSVAQKRIALEKVAALAIRATDSEREVILSCLLSEIASETDPEFLAELIGRLEPFADAIAGRTEWLGALARRLLKILADHYHMVKKGVVRLFDALGPKIETKVAPVLWEEVEAVSDRRLRALFLGLLGKVRLPPALRSSLASGIASVLSTSFGEEIEAREFLEVGRQLGDVQIRACLDVLDSVSQEYLPNFVRSLDYIANTDDTTPESLRDVADAYLKLLQSRGRVIRMTILESPLIFNERLPDDLQEKFAGDFVANLHLYRMERQIEQIETAIIRIGAPALPALRKAVSKSPHDVEREAALRLIAEIHASSGESTDEILDFLEKFERSREIPRGTWMVALARVASHAKADPARAAKIFARMRGGLGRGEDSFDLILALGHLAEGPATPAKEACDLILELVGALEGKLPDPQVTTVDTEDGPRLTFGRETLTYTEFVPNVLEAIGRIYNSDKLPGGIRIMVTRRLLKRWKTLVTFEEVWAPGNLIELAETLSLIFRHRSTPPEIRDEVGAMLLANSRNTTLARVLADTLVFYREEGETYVENVEAFVDRLFELFADPGYQQQDDRRVILNALGRLGAHVKLASSKKKSETSRERIVETLVEASSPTFREGHRLLRLIAESGHGTAALRRRLKDVIEG